MKLILALVLALFSTVASAQMIWNPTIEYHKNVMVIKNDRGGPMPWYFVRYMEMGHDHIKLAIDGECSSSCTLFFKYIPKEDVCVTDNAKLGFHRSNRVEGTTIMLMQYPMEVMMWIMTVGLTEDIKYLPDEVRDYLFDKCDEKLINPPQDEKVD